MEVESGQEWDEKLLKCEEVKPTFLRSMNKERKVHCSRIEGILVLNKLTSLRKTREHLWVARNGIAQKRVSGGNKIWEEMRVGENRLQWNWGLIIFLLGIYIIYKWVSFWNSQHIQISFVLITFYCLLPLPCNGPTCPTYSCFYLHGSFKVGFAFEKKMQYLSFQVWLFYLIWWSPVNSFSWTCHNFSLLHGWIMLQCHTFYPFILWMGT